MQRPFAVTLLVALALAGCLDGEAGVKGARGEPPASDAAEPTAAETSIPPAPEPTVSEVEGSIAGFVVDDEQVPISGATVVHVATVIEYTTDDEGRFTINGLQPGQHTLVATRVGYKDGGRNVEVAAGETNQVTIELVPDPNLTEPTMVHLAPWDGMIGCGVGFHIITSADLCGSAPPASERSMTIGRHLSAVHWEMHWSPGPASTARYLKLTWVEPIPSAACSAAGTSPLVRSCALKTEGDFWESNETQVRHYTRAVGNSTTPTTNDVVKWSGEQSGPVVQHRFRVYTTLFYNGGEVPAGFRNGPPA